MVLFTPIILYSIYFFYVTRQQQYKIKDILSNMDETTKQKFQESNSSLIVQMSFNRVNGWCKLKAIYTIIHFCFNFWSIAYAVLGLGFDNSIVDLYIKLCAVISILTLSLNLFLKSEKKWMAFKRVWAEGSVITNKYISQMSSDYNITIAEISQNSILYSEDILKIENSLNGDDII